MMKVKKIVIAQGFEYDEEIFVEAGIYDFVEEGTNGYPMILVNDLSLDNVQNVDIHHMQFYKIYTILYEMIYKIL